MSAPAREPSVREQMEPMLEAAEKGGLWLYSNYQGLWFSPRQLRRHHARGEFLWGPVNWALRDPDEMVVEARAQVEKVIKDYERIVDMVAREQAKG